MPSTPFRLSSCVLCLSLSIAAPLFADVIQLTDGRSFSGSLQRSGDNMIITTDDHKTVTVPASSIAKVTLQGPQLSPADAAASAWKSVSAEITHAASLDAVIKLHKDFLARYPDQPASADARASLASYEALVGENPVRFRGKWMTTDMIQKQKDAWSAAAASALAAYNAGNYADARSLAGDLAVADPANPYGLEIAGLAAFKQNDLQKARQAFAKLSAVDPDNALAENNLGVVSFMQKLQPEGLVHYTKAIQSRPDNRIILDNAASALGIFTGSKDIDAYRNLNREYTQAEQPMEAAMAKINLYRDGGGWATKQQRDKRAATKQEILTQMSELDAKFAIARQSLDLITQKLAAVQADYDNTSNQLNSLNITNLHTSANPNDFQGGGFDYQRGTVTANLQNLAAQRADLLQQAALAKTALTPFYAQADKLKAALATATDGTFSNPQALLEIGQDDNPPLLPEQEAAKIHLPASPTPVGPTAPTPATPTPTP